MNDADFAMKKAALVGNLSLLVTELESLDLDYPQETEIRMLSEMTERALKLSESMADLLVRVENRRGAQQSFKHGRRLIGRRMVGGSVPIYVDCAGPCDLNSGCCTCGDDKQHDRNGAGDE